MKPIRTLLALLIIFLLPAVALAAKGKDKTKTKAKPAVVTINGTIMSAETNKPVSGAVVVFYGRSESGPPTVAATVSSDNDGKIAVQLKSGFYTWHAKAEGYGLLESAIPVKTKQPDELKAYLKKQAFLSGRLIDGKGQPMKGVTVLAGRWIKAISGDDGRFVISGLDNRGYEPKVAHAGWVMERNPYQHLSAGQKVDLGDLVMRRAGSINVTVVPTNNGPKRSLDKIGLYLSGNSVYRSAKTSPPGTSGFNELPPGNYSLSISDERMHGTSREVTIKEGENLSLTLEAPVKPASLTIEDYTDVFLPQKPFSVRVHGLWAEKAEAVISVIDADALLNGRVDLHKPDQIPVGLLKKVSSFPVTFKIRKDSYTTSNRIKMPELPPGAYLLEMNTKGASARFGFLVTGLGLIAKSSPSGALLFATDLVSGKALAGTVISSRNSDEVVTTDQSGVAEWNDTDKHHLMARYGKNMAFLELATRQNPDNSSVKGYVYTDRPAYRPGQTVYFKGVLRQRSGEEYALPTSSNLHMTVSDSGEKAVCETDLTISDSGSFHGECTLPAAAALGGYSISASANGETWHGSFKVLEYRKPEFEVKVVPERRFLVSGDTAGVKLTVRYYFGGAVANGKVKWRIYSQPAWGLGQNSGEDGDSYDNEERFSSGYSDFLGEGDLVLNENGETIIPVTAKSHDMPYSYTIEADVTDSASRQVSASGSVSVVPSLVSLNVRAGSYLTRPATPVEIRLSAADWEGAPKALPALLQFEYQQYDKKLRTYTWKKSASVNVKTTADGSGRTSFSFPHSGYWRIVAEAVDQAGRKASATTSVWVWKDGYDWEGSYRDLEAEFDRKSYKPGETARLIVRSPSVGGTLLLTIEGRDIRKRLSIPLKSMVQVIELPVLEEYAPIIQVSAVTVGKGRFFSRTVPLRVDHQPGKLDILVKTDKQVYAPGEKVQLTLTSRDGGKAVPGEMSLAVVDEAIFAVSPDRQEDIWQFFLGNREHLVTTLHSFPRVYLGGAAKDAGAFQAKEDELKGLKIRKIFKDTAYWQPMLTSNSDGSATAEFTLPDNLTTWRATAVGHSGSNRFGSSREKFIARLELMARLSPPRFLTVGDELKIPGVITSMTNSSQKAKGRFETEGLTLLNGNEFNDDVSPRGTLRRDATVKAEKAGNATLRLLVKGALTGDAMELVLPVLERGITRFAGTSIALREQEAVTELTLPDNALPGSAELKLTFSPTIAANLNSAINRLVEFPYGCVEQTLSRFIPAVHARKLLAGNAWQPDAVTAEKLPLAIAEGLKRLEDMQHGDGGWGWWKTDNTSLTMTAHAVYGLSLAKKAGVDVPTGMLNRGIKSLEQQISSAPSTTLPRAYRALALSGKRSSTIEQKIASNWKSLPVGDQLAFVEALNFSGQRETMQPLLAELKTQIQSEGNAAFIRDKDAESWWYGWRWGSSVIETTSGLLSMLVSQNPADQLNSRLAEFLVRRQNGGWWQTTSSSAAAVTALADYVGSASETTSSYSSKLQLNNKDLAEYLVDNGRLLSGRKTITVPAASIKNGVNRLVLTKGSGGAAYVTAELKYAVPPEAAQSSSGLKLERTLYRVRSVKTDDKWRREYTQLKPGESINTGDDIEVRLIVENSKTLEYLIIEDRLPAGFESRETDRDPRFMDDSGYYSWFTHRERRDDKMAYFITTLPVGRHEFRHVIYPELTGKALALPASVWPMYQPELRGESTPWQFEIKQH